MKNKKGLINLDILGVILAISCSLSGVTPLSISPGDYKLITAYATMEIQGIEEQGKILKEENTDEQKENEASSDTTNNNDQDLG